MTSSSQASCAGATAASLAALARQAAQNVADGLAGCRRVAVVNPSVYG
jgi:hypothetical protein